MDFRLKNLISLILLLIVVSCNPLLNNEPQFYSDDGRGFSFSAASQSKFSFSSDQIRFTSNSCELNSSKQTVLQESTSSDITWDSSSGLMKLGANSDCNANLSCSSLDAEWTPSLTSLKQYFNFDGQEGPIADGSVINSVIGTNADVINVSNYLNFSPGKLNQSVSLFGNTGNYLKITAPDLTNGSYTFSMWINPSASGSGTHTLFDTTNRFVLYLEANSSNKISYFDGQYRYTTVDSPKDNKWHHLAWVFDAGTSSMHLYLDRKHVYTGAYNSLSLQGPWFIGSDLQGDQSPEAYMDEFALWNSVLSETQIQSIYDHQLQQISGLRGGVLTSQILDGLSINADWKKFSWVPTSPFMKSLSASPETISQYVALPSNSTLSSSLIALWNYEDQNGPLTIHDSSTHGNNGTISNMSFEPVGRIGKGGSFNGYGEIIVVNDTSLSSLMGDFTISSWILNYNTPYGETAVTLVGGTDSASISSGGNTFTFLVNGQPVSGGNNSDRKYHHVVGIRQSGVISLYVDDVFMGSTISSAPIHTTHTVMGVGSIGGADNWNGYIDEVAIWNRSLNPSELSQLNRRGSDRIKFQVRTCTADDCSDDPTGENWIGYFSEANNPTPNLPSLNFSDFTSPADKRYFQYRSIFESDSSSHGPELKSVKVEPSHYADSAEIQTLVGLAPEKMNKMIETSSCAEGITYSLSINQTDWYYLLGSNWVIADGTDAQANSASDLTASGQLPQFQTIAGTGAIYLRAFLKSTNHSTCSLTKISFQ